jgi:fructosamine-3-kinase
MISEQLRSFVEQTLGQSINSINHVSGGSINQAAKISLSNGKTCFLKWNKTADPRMFAVEEKGLELLASADTDIRIPEVYATGETDSGTGFLVQEYIVEGKSKSGSAETFGKNLAKLHRQQNDQFGLEHNNYIGRLPQSNSWHKSWGDFFIEERMKPQIKMATDAGKLGSSTTAHFETLYKKLPNIFPNEPASLLHGDLWGGNYFYDDAGGATIFDPAVYYGHREIELAFTYLFGGFSQTFYQAYEDEYPLEPNFNDRKDVYNLYLLLVHTNLFGGHYAQQVKSIVNRF